MLESWVCGLYMSFYGMSFLNKFHCILIKNIVSYFQFYLSSVLVFITSGIAFLEINIHCFRIIATNFTLSRRINSSMLEAKCRSI